MPNQNLLPSEIRRDGGTQSRQELNSSTIAEYAEALSEGAIFPAVVVYYDGENYWLADGFHRTAAAEMAGRSVAAEIRQGTRRDAVLHSVGANANHGLRRTNDDKRNAVRTLLEDEEWSQWSDREIARRCGVHHQMVARLRPQFSLDESSSERTYTTRHGTTATMSTGAIGGNGNGHKTAPATTQPQLPPATPLDMLSERLVLGSRGGEERHTEQYEHEGVRWMMSYFIDDDRPWMRYYSALSEDYGSRIRVFDPDLVRVLDIADQLHNNGDAWRQMPHGSHVRWMNGALKCILDDGVKTGDYESPDQFEQAAVALARLYHEDLRQRQVSPPISKEPIICWRCEERDARIMESMTRGTCDQCALELVKEREEERKRHEYERNRAAILEELGSLRRAIRLSERIADLARKRTPKLAETGANLYQITDQEIDESGDIDGTEEDTVSHAVNWLDWWVYEGGIDADVSMI